MTRRSAFRGMGIAWATGLAAKAESPARIRGTNQAPWDPVTSYTKCLPHNALGEVEPQPLGDLRRATRTGQPADFEAILLGNSRKLTNPLAAFSFELDCPPPSSFGIPAPPAFGSAEQGAEAVELYWKALARDVPFDEYQADPIIRRASEELTGLPAFRGPRTEGAVTPNTLFRGSTPGDLHGPYISQFLWKDFQYGAYPVAQKLELPETGIDYGTTYKRWMALQNGEFGMPSPYQNLPRYHLERGLRYIRSGRDLAEFVHRDFTYQAFISSLLILMGMNAPFDKNAPYTKSKTQVGFSTFGEAHVFDLLARVANSALKAAWYQKWVVYGRLRPEEFGARVHLALTGLVDHPVWQGLRKSAAVTATYQRNGSYLLPLAYPEGCPTHPAYPAGHAVVAGACTTVLKAFFDERFVIRNPVVPASGGHRLERYEGPDLLVEGELNKLAFNIALGRDFAGVHWRSDGLEGIRLGEHVALAILRNIRKTCPEKYGYLTLTKFDGERVEI